MKTDQWWYRVGDRQGGPLSLDGLRQRVSEGLLRNSDLVWNPGLPGWVPAASIDALFDTYATRAENDVSAASLLADVESGQPTSPLYCVRLSRNRTLKFFSHGLLDRKRYLPYADVRELSYSTTKTYTNGIPSQDYHLRVCTDRTVLFIRLDALFMIGAKNKTAMFRELVAAVQNVVEPILLHRLVRCFLETPSGVKVGRVRVDRRGITKGSWMWHDPAFIPWSQFAGADILDGEARVWRTSQGSEKLFAKVELCSGNAVLLPSLLETCSKLIADVHPGDGLEQTGMGLGNPDNAVDQNKESELVTQRPPHDQRPSIDDLLDSVLSVHMKPDVLAEALGPDPDGSYWSRVQLKVAELFPYSLKPWGRESQLQCLRIAADMLGKEEDVRVHLWVLKHPERERAEALSRLSEEDRKRYLQAEKLSADDYRYILRSISGELAEESLETERRARELTRRLRDAGRH